MIRILVRNDTNPLADQLERMLLSEDDTPGRRAIMAHVRATYVRLGWRGRGRLLEWHPRHLEEHLSDEMTVEAWLAHRLHTGVRLRMTGDTCSDAAQDSATGERGPPIWELDERAAWRPDGTAEACAYRRRSRRLTASGIREWVDISHKDGAWLSWQEVKSKYMPYGTDADEQEYRAVIDDLNGGRWEGVRSCLP